MDGAGEERRERWVRLTEHSRTHPLVRRWWLLTAARYARETVRGHDGTASIVPVLRLYLAVEDSDGRPAHVRIVGDEAERLRVLLDAATADAPEGEVRAA